MKRTSLFLLSFLLVASSVAFFTVSCSKEQTAKKETIVKLDEAKCYECHETVKMLHNRGQHASVNCAYCHKVEDKHLEAPDKDNRPFTRFDWYACGECHKDQMDSFMKDDYHKPARNEKSSLTGRSPNPMWDKIMAPHGFTKEHAVTRSRINMLLDQFVVDRAFGGRFQGKNGWNYILETGKVWDIIEDKYPDEKTQKAFMRQTATAANPVCMTCKTADYMLDWQYMGEPHEEAKWSRQSNPVEMAKAMNYPLNCFICHDPHSAEPRIVRDALIDAMTNPEASDNLYQKDPNKAKIEVIEMGERGFTRKIAILQKDEPKKSVLLCAQCHVEYNCNPGVNPDTKEPIKFNDAMTNHFPFKTSLDLYDHYFNKVKFQDFTNRFSGSPLWKAQHPEAETYYESKHANAGVDCHDCHFSQEVGKNGKKYTSHFATSPKNQLAKTCLTESCHGKGAEKNWDKSRYSENYIKTATNWNEEKAIYTIDSIKAYTKGRMRKAEFWLAELTDMIRLAKINGVSKEIIAKAQEQQTKAHILWEYWTAENSDGFHNPELARESLTKSIDESMAGYKLLEDAMVK